MLLGPSLRTLHTFSKLYFEHEFGEHAYICCWERGRGSQDAETKIFLVIKIQLMNFKQPRALGTKQNVEKGYNAPVEFHYMQEVSAGFTLLLGYRKCAYN